MGARLPVPGGDANTWGNILNDFMLVEHNADGSHVLGMILGSPLSDGLVLTSDLAVGKGFSWKAPTVAVDASTANKGIVRLAGDISGTADSPTVPALAAKISSSQLGQANGVASLDGATKIPITQIPLAARARCYSFSCSGTLVVMAGAHRLYNDSQGIWTINSVRASVGTAPAGSSLVIDVLLNGATIFTTSANRPTILAAQNTSGRVTNIDITSVGAEDYLTINIVQVGSLSAGTDLVVQLEVQQ